MIDERLLRNAICAAAREHCRPFPSYTCRPPRFKKEAWRRWHLSVNRYGVFAHHYINNLLLTDEIPIPRPRDFLLSIETYLSRLCSTHSPKLGNSWPHIGIVDVTYPQHVLYPIVTRPWEACARPGWWCRQDQDQVTLPIFCNAGILCW